MDRLAQGVGQADGDREGELLVAEIVEQPREFVATKPRRHVGRAERFLDPPRGRDEDVVATGVTERVVEALEVVEVDEEDGEWPPVPTAAAVEGSPDPLPEESPVGETRQAVVERLVSDRVVEAGVLARPPGPSGLEPRPPPRTPY